MNFTHLVIQPDTDNSYTAETIYNQNQPFWWDAARIIEDDFTFPLYEKAPAEVKHKGKKNRTVSDDKHGHYIKAVPAKKDYSDVAADATLRCASLKQSFRQTGPEQNTLSIKIIPADIMKKIRIRKNTSLVVFLIDLSWSMADTQRLAATKKAISTILSKAYQFRDDICLIAFQKDRARVIIPPTHSIHLAESAMQNIPVGGKTPLSAGLALAHEVLQRESIVYGKENICLILLSDCEGNVAISDRDPQEEAVEKARQIASGGYRSIVINSDKMSFGQGYANNLAKQLNASCYLISGFSEDHLIKAVRNELIL